MPRPLPLEAARSPLTYSAEPLRGVEQLGAEGLRGRDDERHGYAFDGQPDGPTLASLEDGDDRRKLLEAGEDRCWPFGGADHGEVVDELAEKRRAGPATSPSRAVAIACARGRLRLSVSPRDAFGPLSSAALIFASVAAPTPGTSLIRPAATRTARKRRDAVDVERAVHFQHALGGEPQRTPVADQVRLQLRFERLQLGDVARFHALAELGLDARTDSAAPRILPVRTPSETDAGVERTSSDARAYARTANGFVSASFSRAAKSESRSAIWTLLA